jgi:hypothetical protein
MTTSHSHSAISKRPAPYTEADGRIALHEHIRDKAVKARERHPDPRSPEGLSQLLEDREVVRYPLRVCADPAHLEPGDLAYLQQLGEHPSEGFILFVHPLVEAQADLAALVVTYSIPSVNYGEIVSTEEGELFGAIVCCMDREEFYEALCGLSDQLGLAP